MKCNKCNSEEIISSSQINSMICLQCGNVLSEEEDLLISENPFTEISKIGNPFSSLIQSSSQGLTTITKLLTQIISQLNLPKDFLETGKRYYQCAINKKFTKGRSLLKVACVILYTLCRLNKTRHLLIDFSDISKINLYHLGIAYIRFVKLFQLTIPMVDPSLFIKRFCAKLGIGNVNEISLTSMRIVQCMKDQWITDGRNPYGICGAAIFIGLKCHGYNAKIEAIAGIVKVTGPIIKMRIEEFEQTPYSRLSKEEFDKGDFGYVSIMDPPSFSNNRLKEKEKSRNKEKEKETSSITSKGDEKGELVTKCSSFVTPLSSMKTNENRVNLYEEAINIAEEGNGGNGMEEDEEILSEMNDDDCDEFINSNKEYDMRKILWEEKNKKWIEEQKEKEKHEMKEMGYKGNHYRRNYMKEVDKEKNGNDIHKAIPKTPGEAIMKSKSFRKMGLNKTFLNQLFHESQSS